MASWHCLQILETFKEQSSIFDKLLDNSKGEKLRHVFPLILGIKNTSNAIALLRQDLLLNEANVLTRMLIERVINLCFLLVAEPSDIQSITQKASKDSTSNSKINSAEDLIEVAKQFRFDETYDTEALQKKLAVLESRSKARIDFFRLVIATHYPQASAAMSGSIFGAVCHLKTMEIKDLDEHFQNEFTLLFFTCSSLLHEAITVIAMNRQLMDIANESDKVMEKAGDLMMCMHKAEKIPITEWLWKKLEDLEQSAKKHFNKELGDYQRAFSLCAEVGVEIPHLGHDDPNSLRFNLSALFLKRVLNDLRGVWLLLNYGYTSQAASIAASLFENAQVVKCIATSEKRALKLKNNSSRKLPWDVATMCNIVSKDEKARGESTLPDEDSWKLLYGQYSWLCEIKHPTLQQAVYDAGATAYGKSYAVMPLPDARKENLGTKKLICIIVLIAARSAINVFARATGVQRESDEEKTFTGKMEEINTIVSSEIMKKTSLSIPFGLQDTEWGKQNLKTLPCIKS